MLGGTSMSATRKLRCYQYIDRPYEAVRNVLRQRPLEICRRATMSAAARAGAIAASLHTELGGVDVAVDVRLHVHAIHDDERIAGISPVTRISLGWEAATLPALFPVMSAEVSIWPLTSTETQLEIEGDYRPPLGAVGNLLDAALGHRVADASVHRFLDDIVEQLRRELPKAS
jgi:hypothetical protein